MPERTFTNADQKFYEWFHVHGEPAYAASVEIQRRIFMAGWLAAQESQDEDA